MNSGDEPNRAKIVSWHKQRYTFDENAKANKIYKRTQLLMIFKTFFCVISNPIVLLGKCLCVKKLILHVVLIIG